MTPFNSATSPGRSGTEGGNDVGKGLICATAESLTGFAPDAKFAAHYGQGFRPLTPFAGSQFSSLRDLFTLSSLLFRWTLMNAFEHFVMVDQLSAPDRLSVGD
jgi:hypothetical protein